MGIVNESRADGELVFEFDQSESPVLTQPGPWGSAYDGFCAGMAMKWIALRLQGKDFAYDPKTLKLDMPHWHAVRNQNIYDENDYETAMKAQGLKMIERQYKWNGAVDPDRVHTIAYYYGCYLIRLRREGGGHAVALQHEKGAIFRFMDANYGEFRIAGHSYLKKWIAWYLSESGYKARYTKETHVYQIKGI